MPFNASSKWDLRNEVYERIKKDILSREHEQGSWLQEEELAEKYQVSRTPVREALQRLQSDGFLEIIPRRGAFVVKLTFKTVMEMAEVREALEDLAISHAVNRISEEELQELHACVDPQAVESIENKSEIARRMTHFHHLLAKASGNETLSVILSRIYDKLDMYRSKALGDPERLSRRLKEHREIVEAIEKGNAKLAKARNRAHMRNVKEDINNDIHLFE